MSISMEESVIYSIVWFVLIQLAKQLITFERFANAPWQKVTFVYYFPSLNNSRRRWPNKPCLGVENAVPCRAGYCNTDGPPIAS